MEYKKDQILEGIRESLRNYELPYEEGAWESFCDKSSSRLIVNKVNRNKWIPIAAAIVFLILVQPLSNSPLDEVESKFRLRRQHVFAPQSVSILEDVNVEKNNIVKENKVNLVKLPTIVKVLSDKQEELGIYDSQDADNILDSVIETDQVVKRNNKTNKKIETKYFYDDLVVSNLDRDDNREAENEKWGFGVEVSSFFASDKINLGAGLFTKYKLSDKFSLAAGISFAKMDIAENQEPFSVSQTSRKIGFESDIQTLDIPLSIVYQVHENLYASVGVSSLSVLNENKSYKYETDILSESYVTDPKTGLISTQYTVLAKEYNTVPEKAEVKGNSHVGYLNLSIGKKQNFYGKSHLLLEPFVKVPLGKISSEDIKVMNVGLKIGMTF